MKRHRLKNSFLCFILATAWSISGSAVCVAQKEGADLSYYEVIERRNFFRPKKEKDLGTEEIPRDEHPPSPLSSNPTEFIVTGIVKIRGAYKAIVESKDGEKSYYLKTADALEAYEVREIKKDALVLIKDDQLFELRLQKSEGSREIENPKESAPGQKQKTEKSLQHTTDMMQRLRTGIGGPR